MKTTIVLTKCFVLNPVKNHHFMEDVFFLRLLFQPSLANLIKELWDRNFMQNQWQTKTPGHCLEDHPI